MCVWTAAGWPAQTTNEPNTEGAGAEEAGKGRGTTSKSRWTEQGTLLVAPPPWLPSCRDGEMPNMKKFFPNLGNFSFNFGLKFTFSQISLIMPDFLRSIQCKFGVFVQFTRNYFHIYPKILGICARILPPPHWPQFASLTFRQRMAATGNYHCCFSPRTRGEENGRCGQSDKPGNVPLVGFSSATPMQMTIGCPTQSEQKVRSASPLRRRCITRATQQFDGRILDEYKFGERIWSHVSVVLGLSTS